MVQRCSTPAKPTWGQVLLWSLLTCRMGILVSGCLCLDQWNLKKYLHRPRPTRGCLWWPIESKPPALSGQGKHLNIWQWGNNLLRIISDCEDIGYISHHTQNSQAENIQKPSPKIVLVAKGSTSSKHWLASPTWRVWCLDGRMSSTHWAI